jgi:hypothetical protein
MGRVGREESALGREADAGAPGEVHAFAPKGRHLATGSTGAGRFNGQMSVRSIVRCAGEQKPGPGAGNCGILNDRPVCCSRGRRKWRTGAADRGSAFRGA